MAHSVKRLKHLRKKTPFRAKLVKSTKIPCTIRLSKRVLNFLKSSKFLNVTQIINQFKNFLLSQVPALLPQMKAGKGGDVFAESAYKALYSIIQSNLNDVGWAKKQLAKTILPNKDNLLIQMKEQDTGNYFYVFKQILDLGFGVGWMDETQQYEDNFLKWSKDLQDWVDKRQKVIKYNFINLIVNSIYQ